MASSVDVGPLNTQDAVTSASTRSVTTNGDHRGFPTQRRGRSSRRTFQIADDAMNALSCNVTRDTGACSDIPHRAASEHVSQTSSQAHLGVTCTTPVTQPDTVVSPCGQCQTDCGPDRMGQLSQSEFSHPSVSSLQMFLAALRGDGLLSHGL